MGIGLKAMINASKVITMTGIDLFNNPSLLIKSKTGIDRTNRSGIFSISHSSVIASRRWISARGFNYEP